MATTKAILLSSSSEDDTEANRLGNRKKTELTMENKNIKDIVEDTAEAQMERKRLRKERKRREYGIPRACNCGARMTEVGDAQHGNRFFTCAYYEDDGDHTRKPWVIGVEEEFEKLIARQDEQDSLIWAVREYRKEMSSLKEEVQQLKHQVAILEKLCFEEAP